VNFQVIQTLINSSGVGVKAYKDVVGEPEEATYDFFFEVYNVEPLTGGYGGGMMGAGGMGMGGGMMGNMYAGEHEEEEHEKGEEKKRTGRNMDPSMRMMMGPDPMIQMMTRGPRRSGTAKPMGGGGEETFLFELHVTLEDKPVAEELMEAVVENLRTALEKVHEDYSSRFEGQLKSAEMQVEQAEMNFMSLQDQLRRLSGGRDLRNERISKDIEMLNAQLADERMQLELDKVSVEDTGRRMAQFKAEAEEQVKDDINIKYIEEMILRQEEQIANAEKLVEAGRSTPAELEEAREKLTRAKIELAKRREDIMQEGGFAYILRGKIEETSTQMNLIQARIKYLEQRLIESQQYLSQADGFELLSIKADVARRNLEDVMDMRNGLSRRVRMIQPAMVSVIGAE
jgi:hypothetical protein